MGLSGRSLLLLCLAGGSWSFSFGVGSQLATYWLEHASANEFDKGLNHALYYLGLFLTSLLAPPLIRVHGLRCSLTGLVLCAVSLAVFPWGGGLLGWNALRFINGSASALTLLPMEAALSRHSADNDRSWNFGFFNAALTLGGAGGIGVGTSLFEPDRGFAFFIVAALLLLAVPVLAQVKLSLADDLPKVAEAPANFADLRGNFLCFGSAWIQGFLEGGMIAFMTLYLIKSRGMSKDLAGQMVAAAFVGVILVQVPIGWLADRLGKLPMLLACHAILVAGLIMVPACESTSAVGLWLFALGASTGALYPLGLAILGDRVAPARLVRVYSWYLAIDCVGSVMGAAAMGGARETWGESAMFGTGLAAIGFVLVAAVAVRLTARVTSN